LNRIEIKVLIEEGLHTRPASRISELFEGIEGRILTQSGEASLSSMLSMMTLGIEKGENVVIETPIELDEELLQKLIGILQG
jgi:phosphotransferase system HPr (HPr) family protein